MAAGDITVVGTDKSTESNTTSSTVQWTDLGGGSAPAANDLCVLFYEHSTAATETVIPTSQGFTQIDNQTDGVSSLTAYKKVCTGSESGSITVTTSVAGRKTLWGIVLRGGLDVHVLTKGGDTGTDANHTPPAATPTLAGCGAIIALGEHGGTAVSATPPSGYTELLEGLISGTNPSFAYLAYKGSAGLLDKLTISVPETPGNIVSNASGSDVTYMTVLISPSVKSGAATGAVSWSAVATGKRVAGGLAAGAITLAGVASGAVAHRGAPTGAISWSGVATGKSTHNGAASGTIGWPGTAAGKRTPKAAATGAVTWAAVANGTRTPRGAASGAISWSGAALGARAARGAATGSLSWVASSNGTTTRRSAPTGALAWSGVAHGSAPVVGGAAGSATGAVEWAATTHGVRVPKASASALVTWVGSATGAAPSIGISDGSAAGTLIYVATATGTTPSTGHNIDVLSITEVDEPFTATDAQRNVATTDVAEPFELHDRPRAVTTLGTQRPVTIIDRSNG